MDENTLLEIQQYFKQKQVTLPPYVLENPSYWYSKVYMGKVLKQLGNLSKAYDIFRNVYEENKFHFDKDIYGSYEEYIMDKVVFFEELARLSFIVTNEPARSIPYLDEALIMLDAVESVYPYVDIKEIQTLRQSYLEKIS